MAEAAHRHVSSLSPQSDPTAVTSLLTFLGDDAFGEWLRRELNLLGVNLRELRGQLKRKENEGRRAVYATPACTLTLDADGALVGGVADFKALAVDVSWQTVRFSSWRTDSYHTDATCVFCILGGLKSHTTDRCCAGRDVLAGAPSILGCDGWQLLRHRHGECPQDVSGEKYPW